MKSRMKTFKLAILFVISCFLTFHARGQEKLDITGVWTGQIFNDSTQKYLPFELAISKKNGEFSGYSYTIFLIDSIENIGVKEVTIKEKNDLIIVRDKKLIDDNYTERPAKGVYTTLELKPSQNDSADLLNGRWFTNKTKLYYPLSGTVSLSRRRLIYETRIIKRLSYLGLANSLSFVRPAPRYDDVAVNTNRKPKKKEEPVMTIVEPELVIEIPKKDSTKNIKMPNAKELTGILETAKNSDENSLSDTKKNLDKSTNPTTVVNKEADKSKDVTAAALANVQAGKKENAVKQGSEKEQLLANGNHTIGKGTVATQDLTNGIYKAEVHEENIKKDIAPTPTVPNLTKAVQEPIQKPKAGVPLSPPKDLTNRKIETIQSVKIQNDSVVLSLYDNGVVDGDTVSVLLNGKTIVSRIGLLTTAFNHTVHLTPDMGDSIKIILYAENLGSIPPNTGLLVIRDGGTNHEIRFSGDMKNNSAIILLRNKRQ